MIKKEYIVYDIETDIRCFLIGGNTSSCQQKAGILHEITTLNILTKSLIWEFIALKAFTA